jgi:hypothetical protein
MQSGPNQYFPHFLISGFFFSLRKRLWNANPKLVTKAQKGMENMNIVGTTRKKKKENNLPLQNFS